jgi:hypothetical protein
MFSIVVAVCSTDVSAALYFVYCFYHIGQLFQVSNTWTVKKNVHVVKSSADFYDLVITGPLREAAAKAAGKVAHKKREEARQERMRRQKMQKEREAAEMVLKIFDAIDLNSDGELTLDEGK